MQSFGALSALSFSEFQAFIVYQISFALGLCDFDSNISQEKYEGWWVYLVDRKTRQLVTKPVYIDSLETEEEVSRISLEIPLA